MLEVKDIKKSFGALEVLDGISFKVDKGEIIGIVGTNGVGKTTLFRVILGLHEADSGEVLIDGKKIDTTYLSKVGYLPEERGLYDKLTIERQIHYFAELKGIPKEVVDSQIDEWLAKFQVKGTRKTKIKELSKGNAQKVMVICTLIHLQGDGDLIICDEPFSGLDVVNQELLAKEFRRLRDLGAIILFSSHNMANVSNLCDRVMMIYNKKTEFEGTILEVKNKYGRNKLVIDKETMTDEELLKLKGVSKVESRETDWIVYLEDEAYGKELYPVITKGQYVPKYSHEYLTLDEIFLSVIEGGV